MCVQAVNIHKIVTEALSHGSSSTYSRSSLNHFKHIKPLYFQHIPVFQHKVQFSGDFQGFFTWFHQIWNYNILTVMWVRYFHDATTTVLVKNTHKTQTEICSWVQSWTKTKGCVPFSRKMLTNDTDCQFPSYD